MENIETIHREVNNLTKKADEIKAHLEELPEIYLAMKPVALISLNKIKVDVDKAIDRLNS